MHKNRLLKAAITASLPVLIILALTSCDLYPDGCLNTIKKYDSSEYYRSEGIQDYTAYAKYYYTDADLTDNEYFKPMTEDDIKKLNGYINDFESFLAANDEGELNDSYDFDRSVIDASDYLYISAYRSHDNYSIYFFDTETEILYKFHNNI